MKQLILVLALIVCWTCGRDVMAQAAAPRVTARFPGSELKWIDIASAEFEKNHVVVDRYTVVVTDEDDEVVVNLRNPDKKKSREGHVFAEYEVVIRKSDLTIVGSNYIR
jgi:hypothetical protein